MQHSNDPSSERPRALSRSLGSVLVVGAVVGASIALTACGGSGSSSSPSAASQGKQTTTLNTDNIEKAIQQASLVQRGAHVRVVCPPGVKQERGMVFSCTAYLGSAPTKFLVTETNDAGHVHYVAK